MRTPLTRAVLVLAALWFTAQPATAQTITAQTITAQIAGESVNTLSHMRRHAALLDKAKQQGEVPLLVQLRDPAGQGSDKRNPNAQLQASEITALQQRVLHDVPGLTQVKSYKHIPFLAARADESALRQLLQDPAVVLVQEDEHFAPLLQETTVSIGATAAWDYGGSGAGQVVAVIDTGVDGAHPFLAGKVVDEACFSSEYVSTSSNFESISVCPDGEERAYGPGTGANCADEVEGCSHGTRVAGIIAGRADDFSGVARDANLMALQVFSRFENYCGATPCARSWVSDQVAALDYIYQKRDSLNIAAVNLSLGGGHYTDQETCDEVNPAMRILITMLHDVGIGVIAAAGNSGLTDGLVAPACLTNAISVGATTKADDIASFSSSATFLDFLAPGQDIYTSIPGGGYASSAGTSFSAPHVAGAWAIVKASSPNTNIEDILATFAQTGIPIKDDRNDVTTSRIQVDLALQASQLPVDLVSFDARVRGADVLFEWETANETNNAGFELEHEVDGEFHATGFVRGQGTVTEHTSYSYPVDNLAPGWHTFRLKQIDFDGRFSYSLNLDVFIEIDGAFHFGQAYPNPFNPSTQFTLTLARTQEIHIAVYNLLGQQVMTLMQGQLEANQLHRFTLDGSNLPSGVYLIKASGAQFTATRSVTLMK